MNPNKEFTVTPELTALAVGSGGLDVLATPALVTMIENTCYNYLEELLSKEETSVGVQITLHHIAPSKVGAQIQIVVNTITDEGKKVGFQFEAFENGRVIARGEHQRVIVNAQKFLSKLS
ncbi:thioesterase family protein [Enterococcus massiliensis]|uniref:thioesterase family protein n=1 Tax=Enterococcus massiliensis TaxID=1640685 RepID=UPI00065E8245|nr:thioesterase family protein [Enterococcus massiliensis]